MINTQAVEHLKILLLNPYTWVLFAFVLVLPHILKFIRRFFPEKLQHQMRKEEQCNIEYQQQPEMLRIRNKTTIGIAIALVISITVSYFADNSFFIFINLFAGTIFMVAIYGVIMEFKANKQKSMRCLKIYDKHGIAALIGIYGGLIVVFIVLIVLFLGNSSN